VPEKTPSDGLEEFPRNSHADPQTGFDSILRPDVVSLASTQPQRMSRPSIVIYDLATGRLASGHQEDYLSNLENALADYSPTTFAPFRARRTNSSSRPATKLERFFLGYGALRRAVAATEPMMVIIPNPEPFDFLLLYLANIGRRRNGRGMIVMFLRRDSSGIAGPGWRARILDWTVRRLATETGFFMVSDTRVAAEHWAARTRRNVMLVSIPVRRAAAPLERSASDPIRLGLLGAFRPEKGARHYPDVVSAALSQAPDIAVECQLPAEEDANDSAAKIISALRSWSCDPRVNFHHGHLDSETYTTLLYHVDIVVLPYDVPSYGPGTSGVLFEAVAAGRLAVVTKIPWAVREYRDHPGIVWLEGTDRESLMHAIGVAVARVREFRHRGFRPNWQVDSFGADWVGVVEGIASGGRGTAGVPAPEKA
jgi:glycosyltransferase involved in cell wall biosynthesis